MNIINKALVKFSALYILITVVVSTLAPVAAQAGTLEWLTAKQDNQNVSFDTIYNKIKDVTDGNPDSDMITVQNNSVIATPAVTPTSTPVPKKTVAVRQTYLVESSAYSSTPDQTDDSPFIMANGKLVHDGAVAANFLPLGTKIRIPALYGDKIFTVEDRMNRRYWLNVDLWFASRQAAKEFGRRNVKIEVVSL